ncbi:sugar porter family MFS transporter [Nibricoccus sp. IMCC34717]|uniref:sugar porter family MFS transporter n=1 Tax=Nibricoccus sp. IMCC34717 TaxID=3034021 RepID=UPI00384D0916
MATSPERSSYSTLALVVLVAATGGFLFGYDTVVINGANQYLKLHFGLTPFQEGLAGASAIMGCMPGALFAGFFSDRWGRRNTLFLCALLYGVSGLASAIPDTFNGFLVARFVSGLAIGASSMICPVYIAELSPAKWRGRLGTLFQMGIVAGIFVTLFINAYIQSMGDQEWNTTHGWRWMVGAEVAPAILLFGLLCVAPESARWLLQVGRNEEAKRVIARIPGLDVDTNAEPDRMEPLRMLWSPRFRRAAIASLGVMIVSQLSGINAILYYSTKVFAEAGLAGSGAFAASVWVGVVNLVFTLVAVFFVDKLGRKPLLLNGLAIQTLALSVSGWAFWNGGASTILMTSIFVFIAAFSTALGPISWLLASEIFPASIRGRAMSVASFTVWISCYVVAQLFPVLNSMQSVGPARTFWIFAAFSLAGFLFVLRFVPETKGRTLEEIEASFK